MLLGLVLQVFNDHATVRGSDLKDALLGSDAELRLSFEAPSLEDLTRIWGALQEPYQASPPIWSNRSPSNPTTNPNPAVW